MVTGAHTAVAPANFTLVYCTLPPRWLSPIAVATTTAADTHSELAKAWTDPPTLLNLGCCLTT